MNPILAQVLQKLTPEEKSAVLHAIRRDPLSPIYRAAAAFYGIALCVVLLWPFDFVLSPTRSDLPLFLNFPFPLLSTDPRYLRDIVSNVVSFVPWGFLLSGVLTSASRLSVRTVILAMSMGLLLSGTVELLQYWSASRFSSLLDVLTNITGTGVGLVFYRWYGNLLDDR
jgi:glycopeptide antibiotics resistance protein